MLYLSYQLGISSLAAVVFHLSTLRYELDFYLFHLAGLYITAFVAIAWTLSYTFDAVFATLHTFLIAVSFNTVLAASILIHRIFFHRLGKFPGPLGARVSKFWMVKKVWAKTQGYFVIDKAHQKYGDFVRIGPRELSINHADAVPQLYASTSRCAKAPFYGATGADHNVSIFAVRNKKIHARRRHAWDRALNGAAQVSYEQVTARLTPRLLAHLEAGEPVDISAWSQYFAYDVMGEVGLGKSFRMLENGGLHPSISWLIDGGWVLPILSAMPWLLRLLMEVYGAFGGSLGGFDDWCKAGMEEKIKGLEKEKPSHIASYLLSDKKSGLGMISKEASMDDVRLIIIAGSDSVAASISVIMYYLASNPAIYIKLQVVLDSIFPGGDSNYSYTKAASIPYLDAIINEALRLQPPAISSLPRVTPTDGLTIGGVYVPGDTIVSVPPYTINRDPRYWEKPAEFIPERWTDENPELIKDRSVYTPFLIGVYQCPGKSLAYMELRTVIARIALSFEVAFADEESAKGYEENMKDYIALQPPSLFLTFIPRK